MGAGLIAFLIFQARHQRPAIPSQRTASEHGYELLSEKKVAGEAGRYSGGGHRVPWGQEWYRTTTVSASALRRVSAFHAARQKGFARWPDALNSAPKYLAHWLSNFKEILFSDKGRTTFTILEAMEWLKRAKCTAPKP